MNNPVNQHIIATDLDKPEKVAEPELRGDSVTADRYICSDYAKAEWQKNVYEDLVCRGHGIPCCRAR